MTARSTTLKLSGNVWKNLTRFRKLGALQSVDSEEETVGIRWISAIGRFHRTRGDGWPRMGGQVKHEGSRRCSE